MIPAITNQDIQELTGNDFFIQLDNEKQAKVVLFVMTHVFEQWKALEIASHETDLNLLQTRYEHSDEVKDQISEAQEIIESLKSAELICVNNQIRIKDNN